MSLQGITLLQHLSRLYEKVRTSDEDAERIKSYERKGFKNSVFEIRMSTKQRYRAVI